MKKVPKIQKMIASLFVLIILSPFAMTNCAGCSKKDKKALIKLFSLIKN